MRFLFAVFIMIIFSVKTFSQAELIDLPIDSTTGRISYTEVVMVDSSLSKQELYSRAREWFAKTYNSSTNVIQMDDKESGKIVGKALMQVYCRSLGSDRKCGFVNYTISIYFKEGRYKFELTDFYHTGQVISSDNVMPDYGACENWINDKRKYPMMSQKAVQKISIYFLKQLDEKANALLVDLKQAMKSKASLKPDW